MSEISVVIPFYNEAGAVRADCFRNNIASLSQWLEKGFGSDYELLGINDGSTDSSTDIAEAAGLPFISYEHNRGKGAATRLGMLASSGNVRVSIDADGSYAPDTVSRLYSSIVDENFDIAVARRAESLMDHDGTSRALGHVVLARSLEKLAPTGVRDTQAGAKAFNKESSRLWLKSCDGYGADRQVLYQARQENLRIAEVPTDINVIPNSHVRARDAFLLAKDALFTRRLSHQPTPSDEQVIASYGILHGTARQLSALAA